MVSLSNCNTILRNCTCWLSVSNDSKQGPWQQQSKTRTAQQLLTTGHYFLCLLLDLLSSECRDWAGEVPRASSSVEDCWSSLRCLQGDQKNLKGSILCLYIMHTKTWSAWLLYYLRESSMYSWGQRDAAVCCLLALNLNTINDLPLWLLGLFLLFILLLLLFFLLPSWLLCTYPICL